MCQGAFCKRGSIFAVTGDQIKIDFLNAPTRDQTIGSIPRGRHEIKAALIHQRHHFIGGRRGFVRDLALGFLFELCYPIVVGVGLTALDISGL